MKDKRSSTVIPSILATIISLNAQAVDSGDLTQHIYDILASMPSSYGGEDYEEPGGADRALWQEIIEDILNKDAETAHTKALTLDYQLTEFTDTGSDSGRVYHILERTATRNQTTGARSSSINGRGARILSFSVRTPLQI